MIDIIIPDIIAIESKIYEISDDQGQGSNEKKMCNRKKEGNANEKKDYYALPCY